MTRDDPDPERSEPVAERLDARHYQDAAPYGAEVAPPCEACGEREADAPVDGRDLCAECVDVARLVEDAADRLRLAANAASEQGVPVAADADRQAATLRALADDVRDA